LYRAHYKDKLYRGKQLQKSIGGKIAKLYSWKKQAIIYGRSENVLNTYSGIA